VSACDGSADAAAATAASSAVAGSDLPLAARAAPGCARDEHLGIPNQVA